MKAQELNGTHLGTRIKVTENGNSATGVLREVNHSSSIITDNTYSGRTFESIGATWVELEFLGGFNAAVTASADVENAGPVEKL